MITSLQQRVQKFRQTFLKPVPKTIGLLLCLIIFVSPGIDLYRSGFSAGLDSSWQFMLHWLTYSGLWDNVCFTHGPMGFLNQHNTLYFNIFIFLVFDLFIVANVLYIIWKIIDWFGILENNKKGWFEIVLLIIYAFSIQYIRFKEPTVILLIIWLFWIVEFYKKRNKPKSIIILILLPFLFFFKISYGVIALILLLGFSVFFMIKNFYSFFTSAGVILVSLICFWLVSLLFNLDIPGNWHTYKDIIAFYSDSMNAFSYGKFQFGFFLFLFCIYIIIGAVLILNRHSRQKFTGILDQIFWGGILTGLLFLMFKESFVRQGGLLMNGSDGTFYISLIVVLTAYNLKVKQKNILLLTVLIGGLGILVPKINKRVVKHDNESRNTAIFPNIDSLELFHTFDEYMGRYEDHELPQEILSEIDDATVDIFPWQLGILQKYQLNYKPRPIPQTYTTYSKWLDEINASYLSSKNAPEYLLYDSQSSIDLRYPFFEEPMTKLVILSRYKYFDRSDNFLLLKRDLNQLSPPEREVVTSLEIEWGEKFNPDTANDMSLVFAKFYIDYTLKGEFAKFLLFPPPIFAQIELANGWIYIGRILRDPVSGGVLINKFVYSNDEFLSLLTGEAENLSDIKAISFHTRGEWAYKKNIRFDIFEKEIIP